MSTERTLRDADVLLPLLLIATGAMAPAVTWTAFCWSEGPQASAGLLYIAGWMQVPYLLLVLALSCTYQSRWAWAVWCLTGVLMSVASVCSLVDAFLLHQRGLERMVVAVLAVPAGQLALFAAVLIGLGLVELVRALGRIWARRPAAVS